MLPTLRPCEGVTQYERRRISNLRIEGLDCAGEVRWPGTEHVHWQELRAAVHEARSRLSKFLEAVDEIETDPRLSREGKAEERKKAADKALAAFAGSRALALAQENAGSVMKKWDAKVEGEIKRAADAHEGAIHAQIREKLAGMKDVKDRMMFLERHAADPTLSNAILSVPAFLSGLTEVELAFVRSKLEQRTLPPEVVEAKVALAKALSEVEVGWERARAKIAEPPL